MSWIITGTQRYQPDALLDQYLGAAVAYSLRNLVGTSNPAVVRVRRGNDNSEADFTATEVSDGTLAAWVGAGNDGFVRTWYDQSGNGNNAGQSTTSLQPQIVSSGAVITDGTKPAIQFVSTTKALDCPDSQSLRVALPSHYTVCSTTSIGTTQIVFGKGFGGSYTNSYANPFVGSKHRPSIDNGSERTVISPSNLLSNTRYLLFATYTGVALQGGYNGSSVYTTSTSGSVQYSSEPFRIGALAKDATPSTFPFTGKMQEIIIYSSDTSANRTAIESNINAHYNIY